jgi:hypothetical protein
MQHSDYTEIIIKICRFNKNAINFRNSPISFKINNPPIFIFIMRSISRNLPIFLSTMSHLFIFLHMVKFNKFKICVTIYTDNYKQLGLSRNLFFTFRKTITSQYIHIRGNQIFFSLLFTPPQDNTKSKHMIFFFSLLFTPPQDYTKSKHTKSN